jgi:hypothetical protein
VDIENVLFLFLSFFLSLFISPPCFAHPTVQLLGWTRQSQVAGFLTETYINLGAEKSLA